MVKPGDPGYLFALVASCTFFMLCSAGMLVVNKLVLRRFTGLPITVVMVQMAFTAVCLVVTPCGLHFGSARDVLRWSLTIPFLFTLMLASSMLALDYASMGAIIVVRNVAPIVTMVIERLFQERIELSVAVVLSLVWVVGGVALYTVHDVHFSPIGMAYMMLNMVSAVLERLLQRKMIAVEPIDVSKGGMMVRARPSPSPLSIPIAAALPASPHVAACACVSTAAQQRLRPRAHGGSARLVWRVPQVGAPATRVHLGRGTAPRLVRERGGHLVCGDQRAGLRQRHHLHGPLQPQQIRRRRLRHGRLA